MNRINAENFLLIFLLLLSSKTSAYRLGFELLTEKNGLSSSLVMDIHQDSKGFLWVATNNGLNRFDGYNFRHFYFSTNDSFSLPDTRVRALSEDRKGKLWIGTSNGLAYYESATEKVHRVSMEFEKDYSDVLDILCDSRDRIWVCTEAGVYLIDQTGKRLGYWTGDGRRDSMPYSGTYKAEEDPWGNIWILSRCGLAFYLETEKQFKVYSTFKIDFLADKQMCTAPTAALFPNRNEIICGSWASGLLRFNRTTGKYTSYLHSPEFKGEGAFNVITGLAWFDDKLYVASHDKGLGWFDTLSCQFTYLRELGLEGIPLPVMHTTQLLVTGYILWVGTTDGLYKLDLRTQMVDLFRFNQIRQGDCLPDMRHIIPFNKQADSLSIASWTCGMWLLDRKEGKMVNQGIKSERFFKSDFNLDFWMSFKDSRGIWWYACSHGLFRKQGNELRLILTAPTAKGLPRGNYFTRIAEDHDGNIWAGSLDGILKFEKGGLSYQKFRVADLVPEGAKFLSNRITDIDIHPNGDVWINCEPAIKTTYTGLLIFRYAGQIFEWKTQNPLANSSHQIPQFKWHDLMIDRAGKFWIASSTGIRIYAGEGFQMIKHLSTSGGLFSDQLQALTEDSRGYVWALYDNGFETDRINPANYHIHRIGHREGLPNALIAGLQAGPDGEVYMGFNRNWMGIYNESLQKTFTQNFRPRITELRIDGREWIPAENIQLEGGEHLIELKFSPMNLLRSDLMKLEVMVRSDNDSFQYEVQGNQVVLNDLGAGSHDLRIKILNDLNKSSESYLLGHFEIAHLWYQRTGVKLLGMLLVLMLTAYIVYLITLNQQKKKQLKAEQEKQLDLLKQKALRAQMNPHFIFNALNSINHFIWENKAEEASAYLSRFARLTRLVLEHTREEWISVEEDIQSLKLYLQIEQLRFGNGFEYDIQIQPEILQDQILIPPMLLQPFAENAIKHAFTEKGMHYRLKISIKMKGRFLLAEIDDNGCGFRPGNTNLHRSVGSSIVADRLKILLDPIDFEHAINYLVKDQKKYGETGIRIRIMLPFIKEQKGNS